MIVMLKGNDGMINLWNGDCIEFMKGLKDNSVDCVITDIAHFYHLSRSDYLRLQIKRVIAREQTEMENWVRE